MTSAPSKLSQLHEEDLQLKFEIEQKTSKIIELYDQLIEECDAMAAITRYGKDYILSGVLPPKLQDRRRGSARIRRFFAGNIREALRLSALDRVKKTEKYLWDALFESLKLDADQIALVRKHRMTRKEVVEMFKTR